MKSPIHIPDPEKKAAERAYLEVFRRACPEFPEGVLLDCETPDFIVETKDGTLGIEIQQVFLPSDAKHPLQANESLQQQVLNQAEQIHRDGGGPPLAVGVFFDDNFSLRKSRVAGLAEEVAALISANTPAPPGGHIRVTHVWFSRSDPVPEEIDRIHIWRYPDTKKGSWTTVDGGFYLELTPAQVQARIDKKEAKYALCREKCDEVWLVLVVPGNAQSSLVELSDEAKSHGFTASYERIYFLEPFDRRCRRLRDSGR